MADETVRNRIEIDGAQALKYLQDLAKGIDTINGKATTTAKAINDMARATGQSYQQVAKQLQGLAGQISEPTFKGVKGQDVTGQVFKQADEINKLAQRRNQYLTLDPKAAQSNLNYAGSVKQVSAALAEEQKRAQAVAMEINKLLQPQQQRTPGGQFKGQFLPDFKQQFASLNDYNSRLQLVQKTISDIATRTGSSFKSVGTQLEKAFPDIQKTNLVAAAVENLNRSAQGLGNTFKSLRQVAAQVDAELTKLQAKGKMNFGGDAAKNVTMVTNALKQVKGTTGASFEQIAAGMRRMGVDGAYVRQALQQVNQSLGETDQGARRFGHGIDLVRTALGTLAAVGIFQILNAISMGFQQAVDQARRFEDTVYRLKNVEKILSLEGADITFEGLQKGIDAIKEEMPIFSREDLAELVGALGTTTSELGYTEDQILQVAKAVAILNVNSTESETLLQTQGKVINALISPASRSIGSLGLSFGEAKLEAKAFEMQILKTGESFKDLTEQEKSMVKLQIVLDRAGQLSGTFGDYLDTNTAKLQQNKAAWSDLLTTIGSIFTAITPLLAPLLEGINVGVNGFKLMIAIIGSLLQSVTTLGNTLKQVFADVFLEINPVEKVKKLKEGLAEAFLGFDKGLQEGIGDRVKQLFPEVPSNMSQQFQNIIRSYIGEVEDTATATQDLQDAFNNIDTSAAEDALEDLLKSLENLQDKINETEEDYENKRNRFLEDSAIEQQRMYEDYQLNVLQTQRAFALRRKEHEDKYRQKELEDERKFQEQLRQLQEKFLFNLEDALRERDARQVLRLIDEYNMEKQALINENELRQQADAERHRQEMDKLEEEEAERLRVLAEEYAVREQRRAEDSALKLQRMDEDHALEMARLEAQKAELLQEAANKIAEEYGLNAEGAQAIYDLLAQYYGTDGALAQLTSAGYAAMLGNASGFLAQLTTIIGQYQGLMSQAASMAFPTPQYNPFGLGNMDSLGNMIPGYANGGAFLATRPTVAQFGEGSEAELVTATPISQLPRLFESLMVNGESGRDGQNGRLVVDLNLSPDLEARVVNRAMDGTAEVVSRINRNKGGGF